MRMKQCLMSWLAAACVSLSLVSARADLNSGLVGHWRYDGCDGKTVPDASGKGNSGTIDGGKICQEKGTKSLELDGVGAHVLINEKTPFNLAESMTAVFWVKLADLRARTVLFGMPHTNDGWTTPMFGMYVENKHAIFGLTADRGGSKVLVEATEELALNAWICLAGTCDGAKAKLYINGTLNAELPRKGKIQNNRQPFIIGKGLAFAKPSIKGRVGELRLYERALSAEEIRALFEQSKAAYDWAPTTAAAKTSKFKDGTIIVETHGSSLAGGGAWRKNPTRLLELLEGYKPAAETVKLSQYGGWMDRPKEKATGFFYTKKIGDRHWLIDPEGYRYFNLGINTVRAPKDVKAVFGSSKKWEETICPQLREIGFNGLGNFGYTNIGALKAPLPWVLRKNFMFTFAKEKGLTEAASGTVGFFNRCMPVFHPDFEAFCDTFGRDLAATANDPYLVGIMTDNEIQCPVDLLDRYLALDASKPNLKPGHDAAVAWLAANHKSTDLKKLNQRDRYEFITYAFEQYYRIVSKTIRKYDPHHLYLGSRINYHSGEFDNAYFWKMLEKYHDVISVNYYGYWGPQKDQFAEWASWCDRPVILTEWYAKAMDVPGLANAHGAGFLVHTQNDRAAYYQHFAMNAFEIKNIVGFHFFKYLDDGAESTALDSAGGANKGMFDVKGAPYKPLVERARAVNRELYPLIEFFDKRNQ